MPKKVHLTPGEELRWGTELDALPDPGEGKILNVLVAGGRIHLTLEDETPTLK